MKRFRKHQQGFTIIELVAVICSLSVVGGWIANIYKLASSDIPLVAWTAVEILRVVGIPIAPLGAVMGYL